jgi:hypothetical protein
MCWVGSYFVFVVVGLSQGYYSNSWAVVVAVVDEGWSLVGSRSEFVADVVQVERCLVGTCSVFVAAVREKMQWVGCSVFAAAFSRD